MNSGEQMLHFLHVHRKSYFCTQKRKMTSYPQESDASARERERFFPVYSNDDKHPNWTALPLSNQDRLSKLTGPLNMRLASMATEGTMGSPLRMWNTATTTIPLGNVRQFQVAANIVKSDLPVLPFGQVSLDQAYPYPTGPQRQYGFA
jgi:hypothetical protein